MLSFDNTFFRMPEGSEEDVPPHPANMPGAGITHGETGNYQREERLGAGRLLRCDWKQSEQ